jgi:hypothetical protein
MGINQAAAIGAAPSEISFFDFENGSIVHPFLRERALPAGASEDSVGSPRVLEIAKARQRFSWVVDPAAHRITDTVRSMPASELVIKW